MLPKLMKCEDSTDAIQNSQVAGHQRSHECSGDINMKSQLIARTSDDCKKLPNAIAADNDNNLNKVNGLINRTGEMGSNSKDQDGNTDLHRAAYSDNLELVQKLLKKKEVDMMSENDKHQTPLDIAGEKKAQKIIDELVKELVDRSLEVSKTLSNQSISKVETSRVLTPVEKVIELTKNKIKYCLKSLKKLNEENVKVEKVFPKEAEIWINAIHDFVINENSVGKIRDRILKDKKIDKTNEYFEETRDNQAGKLLADKIRQFIEPSKKLTGSGNNIEKPSYKQIDVLIHYTEVFSSEGFDIDEIRDLIKNYFNHIWSGKSECVREFIIRNVDSFFVKLQNFVQHSYKQANVLIYFVEAFALEGSCDSKINKDIKQFFSQFYTEQDRKLIGKVRVRLLKERSPRSQHQALELGLEDINKFTNEDPDYFFQELHNYVQYVQTKLEQKSLFKNIEEQRATEGIEEFKVPKVNLVLKLLEGPENKLGKEIDDTKSFLQEEFEKLIKIAYRPKEITPQMLFNFMVNFYSAFDHESNGAFKKIRNLRNMLMHQFHSYGCSEFGAEISQLRHELFIYYYTEEVRITINKLKGRESPEEVNKCFITKLDKLNKFFETEDMIKMSSASSVDENKGFNAYKSSKSLFPKDESGIQKLVNQYFKFLIFIDSKIIQDDNSIDDERGPDLPLSDLKRRLIAEEFDKLERTIERDKDEDYFDEKYSESKIEFKKFVINDCGVREDRFYKAWALYENNNGNTESVQSDKFTIIKIMNILKKFQTNHNLTNREVISLYDQAVKTSGICGPPNTLVFENLEIIKEGLSRHSPDESIILDEEFSIHRREVVSNIIKTLYNAFNAYRIEFEIEDIFDDEIFLESMVRKMMNNSDYMIIRKLLKLDYTAPYIVKLLTKKNSDETIEVDDLKSLVKILLTEKNGLYIKHLNELLKIQTDNLNLYEEACKILSEGTFDIETMRCVFEKPEHVKEILAILDRKIKSKDEELLEMRIGDGLRTKVLIFLNDVVPKLVRGHKCEEAFVISNSISESNKISSYEPKTDEIILASELNRAKVRIVRGRNIYKLQDKKKAEKMLKEALRILEKILADTVKESSPQYLLALCRKAFAKYLLREYDDSRQEYENLYEKIVKYALSDMTMPNTKTFREIYVNINKSEKYRKLLSLSNEYEQYLNILDIWNDISRCKIESIDIRTCIEALNMYKEIKEIDEKNFGTCVSRPKQSVLRIAYAHNRVGKAFFINKRYTNALKHYEDALAQSVQCLENKKRMYNDNYHFIKSRNIKTIKYTLFNIGRAKYKLGDYEGGLKISTVRYICEETRYIMDSIVFMTDELQTSKLPEEESRQYEAALNIYKEAYSRLEKSKQDKKHGHTAKDITGSIEFIINNLAQLKLSNNLKTVLISKYKDSEYMLTKLDFIATEHRKLANQAWEFNKHEAALNNWQISINIDSTIYKFYEYEYILNSIMFLTNKLQIPEFHEEKSRPYNQQIDKALNIFNEAAFRLGEKKQGEKYEYTYDILGSFLFIINELSELELSDDLKIKLLHHNEVVENVLKILRDIASAHKKIGDYWKSENPVTALKYEEKKTEIYFLINKIETTYTNF